MRRYRHLPLEVVNVSRPVSGREHGVLDIDEHIGLVELMDEGLQEGRADGAVGDEGADA